MGLQFDIIEGRFHDGLGTYAELALANSLIAISGISQPFFDVTKSKAKMLEAIAALPTELASRESIFKKEIENIEKASQRGAVEILHQIKKSLKQVRHVAGDYADAKAGDLILEFTDQVFLPLSVKTDKSGRAAVAEGQTPHIWAKWANRYFDVSEIEFNAILLSLGFNSIAELKAHYLNVSRVVAHILIQKLELTDYHLNDFSRAKIGNLATVKYLLHQLLHYKNGNDSSHVVIFNRTTGTIKWESLLDAIPIDNLTSEQISLLPSRPRKGRQIGATFGIQVERKTVVTFQVKHKRSAARDTNRRDEFSDITTRLQL